MAVHTNVTNPKAIERGTKAVFNETFRNTPTFMGKITRVSASNNSDEKYVSLGSTPPMSKFSDELAPGLLEEYEYSLANETYTASLKIHENLIADQQHDMINTALRGMAGKAARYPQILATAVLESGTTLKGLDGKNFFATDHKDLGNAADQSNLLSGSGSAFGKTGLTNAVKTMRLFKDDKDEIMQVAPQYVMVHPDKEVEGLELLVGVNNSSGASNVFAGKYELIVNPFLTDADAWYLFAGNLKPLIYQNRKSPEYRFIPPASSGDTALFALAYVVSRFAIGALEWRGCVKNVGS